MRPQFACLALLCLAALVALAAAREQGSFCDINDVRIKSLQHFKQLAKKIKLAQTTHWKCPKEFKLVIEKMDRILSNRDNSCTQDRAEQLRNFYFAHLTSKKHQVPKSIKVFFVAYALDLKQRCKTRIVDQLVPAIESLSRNANFQQLGGAQAADESANIWQPICRDQARYIRQFRHSIGAMATLSQFGLNFKKPFEPTNLSAGKLLKLQKLQAQIAKQQQRVSAEQLDKWAKFVAVCEQIGGYPHAERLKSKHVNLLRS